MDSDEYINGLSETDCRRLIHALLLLAGEMTVYYGHGDDPDCTLPPGFYYECTAEPLLESVGK